MRGIRQVAVVPAPLPTHLGRRAIQIGFASQLRWRVSDSTTVNMPRRSPCGATENYGVNHPAKVACSLWLFALPAAAHHTYAMFDGTRSVTLQGTVKELQWTNPHCFLQVLVGKDGKLQEWSVQMNAPAGSISQRLATSLPSAGGQGDRDHSPHKGWPRQRSVRVRYRSRRQAAFQRLRQGAVL